MMLLSDGVSKAYFHTSYRSNVNMKPLFGAMFPGNEVAKQYTMGKEKVSYFVLYGIASVLKEELITTVNKSPFYSIGFDKSLNRKITKWTFMFDFGIQRRAKQR